MHGSLDTTTSMVSPNTVSCTRCSVLRLLVFLSSYSTTLPLVLQVLASHGLWYASCTTREDTIVPDYVPVADPAELVRLWLPPLLRLGLWPTSLCVVLWSMLCTDLHSILSLSR